MTNRSGGKEIEGWSHMKPHDEFLELCAVSTSGDLSREEQERLEKHLAGCCECRQALREFEAVADIGVHMLFPELSKAPQEKLSLIPNKAAMKDREPLAERAQGTGFVFTQRNGHRHAPLNWNHGWLSLAATILLLLALGTYAYRIGKERDLEDHRSRADERVEAFKQRMSDVEHERQVLKGQLAERDRAILGLRHEIALQSAALNEMKTSQTELEQSIGADEAAKQRVAEDNANLAQQLKAAEAHLDKTEAELDAVRQQRAENQVQVADLKSQIDALSEQIREETLTVDKQEELLAHDRDIRELMGARDLYIAEIYNVGSDGETKKPFGRVFYTKEKSLVFYAYDLDQQPGVKTASTYQAWGQRGGKAQDPLNLGIFYRDNAANKRWVLKIDNPTELSEIDAVFVTVEPKGGSGKPTGKPLLFAYLRFTPNHP
jgi:anti-sigma factor RsiW